MSGIVTGQGLDTLRNIDGIFAGPYNDTLIGNNQDIPGVQQVLAGGAGNDTLLGRGGSDFLSGEAGNDVLNGGSGPDVAEYWDQNHAGGRSYGPMYVNLRTGVATGDGTDTMMSIEGATGSEGPDTMIGNGKDNHFFWLFGGKDTVKAGGGKDIVAPGVGANVVDGGAGHDLLVMLGGRDFDHPHPAVTVDLGTGTSSEGDTLSEFENVIGTIYDDTLLGDAGPNKLFGYFGNDILRGRGGDDRLAGQAGADTANGGTGTDWCRAETERNCDLPARI